MSSSLAPIVHPKNPEELYPISFRNTELGKRARRLLSGKNKPNDADDQTVLVFLESLSKDEYVLIFTDIIVSDDFWYHSRVCKLMIEWFISKGLSFRGYSQLLIDMLNPEYFNDHPNPENTYWVQYMYDNGFTCDVLNANQLPEVKCYHILKHKDEVSVQWNLLIGRLRSDVNNRKSILGIKVIDINAKNPEDLHPKNFEDSDLCTRALDLVCKNPNKDKIIEFLTSLTHSERESILIEIGDNCNFWAYTLEAPTIMTHWLIENGGLSFKGHTNMMFRIFEWFEAPNKEANEWMEYIFNNGFTCEVLSENKVRGLRSCINLDPEEYASGDSNNHAFMAQWMEFMQRLDTGLTAREIELGITYTTTPKIPSAMDKIVYEYIQFETADNIGDKDKELYMILGRIELFKLPEFIRKISEALA